LSFAGTGTDSNVLRRTATSTKCASATSAPSSALSFTGGLTSTDQDTLTLNAGSYTFNADANTGTAHLTLNVNNAATSVTPRK